MNKQIAKQILWAFSVGALMASDRCIAETPAAVSVTATDVFIHFHDRAVLALQRGGTLTEVNCDEGDSIVAGQELAKVDDRVSLKALEIAEARAATDVQVRVANAALQLAKQEYENVLAANRQAAQAYPMSEVLRRRSAMETAELQVELAEQEFEVAKLTRDHAREEVNTYKLLAPFDGVVARVHTTRGNSTAAGEKILEVVNTSRIRVHGYVPFKDAWGIRPGAEVTIRVADQEVAELLSTNSFEGKVLAVDTSAETVRRVVGVTAIVENTGGELKDGLSVEMDILAKAQQVAVKQP